MGDSADVTHLEVVVAALQDPQNGVRLFVSEKSGKKRACFHGASVRECLKQYGFEDAKRIIEVAQRLLDAGLVAPFKSNESDFREDRAYFFVEQIVLSRSYIGDHLAKALAYFSSTPYKKGSTNSMVVRKKKEKQTVDLGIFGIDTEVIRTKEKEKAAEKDLKMTLIQSGFVGPISSPSPSPSPRDSQHPKEGSGSGSGSGAGVSQTTLRGMRADPSLSASTGNLIKSDSSAGMAPDSRGSKLIEEDTDEIQFAFNDDDPIPVVKAATLDKLIERLTYEEYIDMRFQINFMVTYRAFIGPLQLLEKLRERFDLKEGMPKRRQVRQLRVLAVLSRWVQHYSEPWVESDELRRALTGFLDHIQQPFPQLARQISDNLTRALEAATVQRAGLTIQMEATPATSFALEDSSVQEAAQQLTLYGALLYASIRGSELLGLAWSKKGKEEKASNILRYINNFNRLSGWVVYTVCTTISLKQRAAMLTRVIALAAKCRELNNYHHAMSIFAALVSAPVRRLKGTWAELTSSTQEQFSALETLFSHSCSYKTYREALRESALPCVPYLGLALTDLTFIEEGNPEKLKGLLNFQRHMLSAKVLEGVYRLQTVLPKFTRSSAMMHWIQNLKTPTNDEEAYQMSLKIEPRNTVEGIEQMLMEEERLRARLQTAEVRNAELEAEVARLKSHITKLDADLRAALKGENPDKQRSSSGAAGAQLVEIVRPKWATFSKSTSPLSIPLPLPFTHDSLALPPPPVLSSSPISVSKLPPPPSVSVDAGTRTTSGRDLVLGMRAPPTQPSSSPINSPPSSPGRSVHTGSGGSGSGAGVTRPVTGDWARTRPSPRPVSPRVPLTGSSSSYEDSSGEATLCDGGARGEVSPMRGQGGSAIKSPRMLGNSALLALKAPPAPPPFTDVILAPLSGT